MANRTYTAAELAAMTNAELDAVVARVVLGWRDCGGCDWWASRLSYKYPDRHWSPTKYWTECGIVIKRMLKRGLAVWIGDNTAKPSSHCRVTIMADKAISDATTTNPCRAICEASILATIQWRAARKTSK